MSRLLPAKDNRSAKLQCIRAAVWVGVVQRVFDRVQCDVPYPVVAN